MRKLHLLLAEDLQDIRRADQRTYNIMRCWMTGDNIPTAAEVFPSLAGVRPPEDSGGMLADPDGDIIFSQVDSTIKATKRA